MNLDNYKSLFLDYLVKKSIDKEPQNLYAPINYILNLGGKRLRPIMVLMACDLLGGDTKKALDAALAIEMFHNFSLIHDDIMDKAPIRRGEPTVHKKWDLNTGILSGDAMLILANTFFNSYSGTTYKNLQMLFNQTALEVCEGQQYDMDFESVPSVPLESYIKMITYKTAVLVAASLKMGAIIAQADEDNAKNLYNFGLNLGIAFQLQDDYLDIYATANFGKQQAGDILENKKTFLFLKTLELVNIEDKNILLNLYKTKGGSNNKVLQVKQLFDKYNVPKILQEEIAHYTNKSIESLNKMTLDTDKNDFLKTFSEDLMHRTI
ncbi:MAG: polyprenyl synthetase family protein [Flavobacteriaceae bacterium]